jgi:hypothetical protein
MILRNRISKEYQRINLKTMKFVYNFAIIPNGSGCSTTSRERESILNKKICVKNS